MSTTTSKGIVYPESTDSVRLWEHFQTMANSINSAIVGSPDVQVFTDSGTWSKPAGALWVVVEVQAAGGGSSGISTTLSGQTCVGPGGAGGEYARGTYAASELGSTEGVVVGSGGIAGIGTTNPTSGGAGGVGGDSSFGSHINASGGGGGAVAPASSGYLSAAGGPGGTGGTGGDFHVAGSDGGNAISAAGNAIKVNHGGASFMAGMKRANATTSAQSTGVTGNLYGGGASGPSNGPSSGTSHAGSPGGDGIVIVTTYKA